MPISARLNTSVLQIRNRDELLNTMFICKPSIRREIGHERDNSLLGESVDPMLMGLALDDDGIKPRTLPALHQSPPFSRA